MQYANTLNQLADDKKARTNETRKDEAQTILGHT